MRGLGELHIRAKIMGINALVCTIALLLAGAIIIAYDNFTYRTQKANEVSVQAQMLASRMTASLEFDDHATAQEYLSPFSSNPEIEAAAVYAADGSLFAAYNRAEKNLPPISAEPPGQRLEKNTFVIFWPVLQGQHQIGSVYLRVDIESLGARIARVGLIIVTAMIVALLITLPIAIRLHYAIANPEYARSLIEASLDPQIIIDPTGKITDVNAATVKVTGVRRAKLIGTDFSDYFTEPEKARESYQQVLAQGAVTDYPLTIRHRDGKLTEVLYNTSVYKDEHDNVKGVFAAARDVTAQKRAEQEMRQRTVELQAANRELESFSYSVSHDLRAPLRSIDGFSQALLEDYADKLDDQGRACLNRVRAATQRMGHLIDDMLMLSRVSRTELQHGTVDLSALAVELTTELQKNEPQRKIDCYIQPGLQAQGDASLLQMALANLFGNAWKYTAHQPQPRIEFNAVDNADGIREFFVRDNGAGFDMAHADKLFGVFQRLHGVSEFPGTGVGLAIVQRIILRHGGKIRGIGTPGLGATFYFTLPI